MGLQIIRKRIYEIGNYSCVAAADTSICAIYIYYQDKNNHT
jgi:hypothetical protein